MTSATTTPTVRLQRVAPGVRLVLETRSPDATWADRVAGLMAEGLGDVVREANDAPLCIALARECARRGKKLRAFLPRHTAIEVKKALQGYRAEVVLFETGEEAIAAAKAEGPLESERQAAAVTKAAEQIGAQIADEVDAEGGIIDLIIAPAGPLLRGISAGLKDRHLKPRTVEASASLEEQKLMRARLGAEEGLLLSLSTAACVVTAAKLLQLLPKAIIYTVALDTGERDFSLSGTSS